MSGFSLHPMTVANHAFCPGFPVRVIGLEANQSWVSPGVVSFSKRLWCHPALGLTSQPCSLCPGPELPLEAGSSGLRKRDCEKEKGAPIKGFSECHWVLSKPSMVPFPPFWPSSAEEMSSVYFLTPGYSLFVLLRKIP